MIKKAGFKKNGQYHQILQILQKDDKKGTEGYNTMAFLRRKWEYFYLVSSYRGADKKPRQKVLAYFGRCPTRKEFEKAKTRVEAKFPGLKIDWDKVAGKLKQDRSQAALIAWDIGAEDM